MEERTIILRILALCESRGWTVYRLAKESGITYSTLCTMLHKSAVPSLSTLGKICNGFGITLAQFFDADNDQARLTEAERAHLARWNQLSPENRRSAEKFMEYLLSSQQ